MKVIVLVLALAAAAPAAEYRRFELAGFEHISLDGTVHAIERVLTPASTGGRVVELNAEARYFRQGSILYVRADVWRDMVERSARRISSSRLPLLRLCRRCRELQ
jgi:hypothetical protein